MVYLAKIHEEQQLETFRDHLKYYDDRKKMLDKIQQIPQQFTLSFLIQTRFFQFVNSSQYLPNLFYVLCKFVKQCAFIEKFLVKLQQNSITKSNIRIMVKAFILVIRGTKKSKVFVNDMKQLYVAPRRLIPPVPKFYGMEHKKYQEERELSCFFATETE